MASRHRFLERSITTVTFHNRLTEEDAMWRQREQERERNPVQRRQRSRSPRSKKHRHRSSSSSEDRSSVKIISNPQTEAEFGPPLPSNLGVDADRWDHAFFMQKYPKDYERQINKSSRRDSTSSSEDERKKKKHSKHDRKKRKKEEHKKKTKRKRRSRS
ncbi:unnamed protein product [Adineta ricciae]|uniref:Uncharacterized protein n=1 Tax=Adineta ricciae TaxID=249248 RepID=A0A815CLD9_ADIRI|nr:unnamed protein product [Adineta ricciae]CAF1285615.1 unnamed protein product [Adineta ricciae]